jgi:hypothetical protein
MTAVNINVEEFISILSKLREQGVSTMNLDMVPDDRFPKMNKLIIHPLRGDNDRASPKDLEDTIQNPDINPDSDDIFNLFNGIV